MAVTSGSGMSRLRGRCMVLVVMFVFGVVLITQPHSVSAQTQGERIRSYDVQVLVMANGTIVRIAVA